MNKIMILKGGSPAIHKLGDIGREVDDLIRIHKENEEYYMTDEQYTSGTSFIDNELPIKENYDKSRRIHRGLFKSNKGKIINSDVNGAFQIMKKVFPNTFVDGIKGCLTPVIINVVKIA